MTIDYEITISQQDCLALRGALQDADALLGKRAESDDTMHVHLHCMAAEVVRQLLQLIGALSARSNIAGTWEPAPREAFKSNGGTLSGTRSQGILVQNAIGLAYQASVARATVPMDEDTQATRSAIRRMMEQL